MPDRHITDLPQSWTSKSLCPIRTTQLVTAKLARQGGCDLGSALALIRGSVNHRRHFDMMPVGDDQNLPQNLARWAEIFSLRAMSRSA